MVTSADIVNQAIQLIGDNQPAVTGVFPTFDTSPAGIAASFLYGPTVATVGREFEWDFARSTAVLNPTGNPAPYPWAYEYIYPADGIQVWEVMPTSGIDLNDPIPINWIEANAIVAGSQARVIRTNLSPAQCVYNNNPNENTWNSLFREAVVRTLASALSLALAGKPDLAQSMLESGGTFTQIGAQRRN